MRKLLTLCLCLSLGIGLCSCSYATKTTTVITEETNRTVWDVIDNIQTPEYPKVIENGWIVLINDEEVEIQKIEPITIQVTEETIVYEEPCEESAGKYIFFENASVDAYATTNNGYWVIPSIRGFIQK